MRARYWQSAEPAPQQIFCASRRLAQALGRAAAERAGCRNVVAHYR